jgi:hypothetical protein
VKTSLMNMFLGVEAFFFGFFTICMLCDQYSVIEAGAPQIDQLKAKKESKALPTSTRRESLAHIFGGDGSFSLVWLIPIDAKWKNPEKEFSFMLPREDDHYDDDHVYENDTNSNELDKDISPSKNPSIIATRAEKEKSVKDAA